MTLDLSYYLFKKDDRMGFKAIVQDKDVHEVCRMFLASLQLVGSVLIFLRIVSTYFNALYRLTITILR